MQHAEKSCQYVVTIPSNDVEIVRSSLLLVRSSNERIEAMTESTRKFETERTQHFRAGELSERDGRTIANIETFGCEVVQVKGSTTAPGWSYTVGIYDTCGQPEIITVGLKESTAHFLLNEAASRLRKGVNLAEGRHREMIGEVDCEFRPVDPKWIKHLMGWATWYNGISDFPVLQAVYPDLENRFPEDPSFTEYFRQPLLQPEASMTTVEDDFWASADPKSSLFNWKFPDPPHTRVFLSEAVQSGREPITYVSHDLEDGAWQFLGDSMSRSQTRHLVLSSSNRRRPKFE
jgi:Domain of unknown function (DUF4262)